jgi:enoyl-CoA hydratase/carnithine racemase
MTEATTLEEGILLVEMNRPDRRNALDKALQGELLEVFDHKEGVRAARERCTPRFGGR